MGVRRGPAAIAASITTAGKALLGFIAADATDDRKIYAVVADALSVGDLRDAIVAIEVEAFDDGWRQAKANPLRECIDCGGDTDEPGGHACPGQ